MSAVSEQLQRLSAALERLESALSVRIAEVERFDPAAIEAEIERRVEDRLPQRIAQEVQALRAEHETEREGLAREVDDAIARLETVLEK